MKRGKLRNRRRSKVLHLSLRDKSVNKVPVPRDILDCFPDMCFVVAADGTILDANQRAKEKLGLTDRRLANSRFPGFTLSDSRTQIEEAIHECFRKGTSHSLEAQLITKRGTPIDVTLSFSRYPSDKSTTQRYCFVFGRDVTAQRKKELDLLRFYNVAQNTINPLEITDAQGRIVYVNPAFERASGYTKEELLGKNPSIFGSSRQPKSFWEKMWKTILSGQVWMGRIENRHKNGEPFFTQLLISPIVDAEGLVVGFFGVHRDISEQKHLEEHLVHAQKMESIGTLAAGLAHEVGNPLTSISSLVQVIQRTTKDEFAKEKLELIKHQITRISKIIRDLVDFSRPSRYEVRETDVNKSVQQAIEIVRVGKNAKAITFRTDLEEKILSLPLVPDQIEQVFINILINAVDAISENPHPQQSQAGDIFIKTSMGGEDVAITIEDNGRGIPDEDLPKVFEPFFTTKRIGEGTGLGLWVSYGIIKSFQGDIRVESRVGRGTKFTITLPLYTELS